MIMLHYTVESQSSVNNPLSSPIARHTETAIGGIIC